MIAKITAKDTYQNPTYATGDKDLHENMSKNRSH